MNKKSTETIKEILVYFLTIRFRLTHMTKYKQSVSDINDNRCFLNMGHIKSDLKKERKHFIESNLESLDIKHLKETSNTKTFSIDEQLIKLNSVLNEKDKVKEIVDLEAHMKKIQVKKIISVKEYKEIYGDSSKAQQNDRGKIKNPLPYNQKVEGGKITYNVDKVDEWREKYNYR